MTDLDLVDLIGELLRPGPSALSGLTPGATDSLAHISVAPGELAACADELSGALAAMAARPSADGTRAQDGLVLASRLFLRAATDTHLLVSGIVRCIDGAVREEVARRLREGDLAPGEREALLSDFAARLKMEEPGGPADLG